MPDPTSRDLIRQALSQSTTERLQRLRDRLEGEDLAIKPAFYQGTDGNGHAQFSQLGEGTVGGGLLLTNGAIAIGDPVMPRPTDGLFRGDERSITIASEPEPKKLPPELPHARALFGIRIYPQASDIPAIVGAVTTDGSQIFYCTGHGLADYDSVAFVSLNALPVGIFESYSYVVFNATENQFEVALNLGDAIAGMPVSLSGLEEAPFTLLKGIATEVIEPAGANLWDLNIHQAIAVYSNTGLVDGGSLAFNYHNTGSYSARTGNRTVKLRWTAPQLDVTGTLSADGLSAIFEIVQVPPYNPFDPTRNCFLSYVNRATVIFAREIKTFAINQLIHEGVVVDTLQYAINGIDYTLSEAIAWYESGLTDFTLDEGSPPQGIYAIYPPSGIGSGGGGGYSVDRGLPNDGFTVVFKIVLT
jgi:hypothetical protein